MTAPPLKIIYIVPGSGDTFYCENCLRDCAAVKALRGRGHDVILVPLYLPLFADEEGLQSEVPVFFGGINVYLQEKFKFFRQTPRWFDRFFDCRLLLNLAARKAGTTRPKGLGAMTLSMLRGTDGNQAKEVARLVEWLDELKPDVVHFSNALLLGIIPELKRHLPTIKIVCSFQDEDTWLDGLEPPYQQQCVDEISRLATQCDGLVAVSNFFAGYIAERFKLSPELISTIPPGLDVAAYPLQQPATQPRCVGFLSRISEKLGAGVLADSFVRLREDPQFQDLELVYGGGFTNDDVPFIRKLQKKFTRAGCAGKVHFLPGLKLSGRLELLSRITVLCVPMAKGEAFGTFLVEAMLSGIPVVQPDVGGFSEIVSSTGGGVLYDINREGEPAATLKTLLCDVESLSKMGEKGNMAAIRLYAANLEAQKLASLYYVTH